MRNFSLIIIIVLFLPALVACGGSGGGGGGGSQKEEDTTSGGADGGTAGGSDGGSGSTTFEVTIDSDLTANEKTELDKGIQFLEKAQIDGSRVSGFNEVFKGNKSSDVVKYLGERVNYIISLDTEPDSRIVFPTSAPSNLQQFFGENPSYDIWYNDQYYSSDGGVTYLISGTPRDVDSTRVGVIRLGDIFVTSDPSVQAITLVHEARHSDCPDGALRSDIKRYVETGTIRKGDTCGQLHTGCVLASCDGGPWGPYAIDYIYSLAIAEACSNCTATQKQEAQANANSVIESAFDLKGTLNGDYGAPNMNSSNRVKEDL